MQRILVLGAGFAGLWSAVGAARKLSESKAPRSAIEVLVIDARTVHSIRVRNYELDPSATQVPLAEVLDPIGVKWQQGRVTRIDVLEHRIAVETAAGARTLDYTRLMIGLGSALAHPNIPGLAEYSFDVDTGEGAARLRDHLSSLPSRPASAGRYTAVVIGAGLTGSEITAELPGRLARLAGGRDEPRVILMDRTPRIADAMGEAQPVIEKAMRAMGVELRPGVTVERVTAAGVKLNTGEMIAAATVMWCGGMRASALASQIPIAGEGRDSFGRLPVDDYMRVKNVRDVYAAGDCAYSLIDGSHPTIMSCQYARPMGRYAGHNIAADLLGEPLLPLRIDYYVTCVDLGPWGAVYTRGRDRRLVSEGAEAKRTKRLINRERIVPPRTGNPEDILRAGAPEVQPPPPKDVSVTA